MGDTVLMSIELSFSRKNEEVDYMIQTLIDKVGGIYHPSLVREMIIAALKAGQETSYLADMKMLNNTMKEMRLYQQGVCPVPAEEKGYHFRFRPHCS